MSEACTVHASAPFPGLAALADAVSRADASEGDLVFSFSGRLLSPAIVTNKLVKHGTEVRPVLCLDLVPIGSNALQLRMRVEQVYSESTRKEAEALAATLKRGRLITFHTTLVGRRVTFPDAQFVALLPQPEVQDVVHHHHPH